MAIKNGTVLLLQVGGVTLDALLSNSFNAAADMLEATTKDSAGAKEYISGEYGWGMAFEALYDESATEGFSEALGYIKAGTSLDVNWGDIATSGVFYNGSGLLSSVDLSGPKNELGSFSGEIQGTAAITEGTAT